MPSLNHTLTIERATGGSDDAYGMPTQTWAVVATVSGSIQPLRSEELLQLSQGGPVSSSHKIFVLYPVDLQASDRIISDGKTYQIDGEPADEGGAHHHLKLLAHTVGTD